MRSRRRSFFSRFMQHGGGVLGALIILAVIAAGLFAPVVAPYDPLAADVTRRLLSPSVEHWLGTDELGRDVLSRLLYGATISIRVGVSVVFLALALGVPIGALSGYVGRGFDALTQVVVDSLLAFPGILLVILVLALLGPSLELATLSLGIVSAPGYARLMRGTVLLTRELPYVEAARTVGCSGARVLTRHIVPNSVTPVLVQATLQMASALLLLAGLGFLGLGAQPPTPEWGAMLAQARAHMRSAPHLMLFPAMAVSLVVLALNLVGDAIRDALDTRLAQT